MMQRDFSDYYSIIQKQENIVGAIKVICKKGDRAASDIKLYKSKGFDSLYSAFLHDETKGKRTFNKVIREEIKSGLDIIKKMSAGLKAKCSEEEAACGDLLKKKEELYTVWLNLGEKKESLQKENGAMRLELEKFLKMREWLDSKKEYINYKYTEYGDSERINELFESWSKEYKNAKIDDKDLRAEYAQARQDEKIIPKVCGDIKFNIKRLRDDISLARYETEEIFKAIPDLEERVKESEEIVVKYREVHKDFEESGKVLNDLREKFERVNREKKETENTLFAKKEELAPYIKTEDSLKSQLSEISGRFNKQEELKEENRALKEVIGPLEKSLAGWREKIKNYETKSAEQNKEIERFKKESLELSSELKEHEALTGPVKELKERLANAEKEIPAAEEQIRILTDETHILRKENEMLSIKAKQFEMIRKKMEGIK